MGNRRLYGSRSFVIEAIEQHEEVWHLVGFFTEGSIKSECNKEYRIRVEPDPRWMNVSKIHFIEGRIYESESIAYVSRRHLYGSGKWYVSPFFEGPRRHARNKFMFEEDFDVAEMKGDGLHS